jgi:hypothetical protein
MADSKISDLTAGTIAAADDIVFVQSGTTKTDTVQGILDLVPTVNSIYSSDDTVTDNARVVTLAGSTAGQYINFNTGGGNAIIQFNGSRQILVPSATEYKYSGAGTHNVTLGGSLSSDSINFRNSGSTAVFEIEGAGVCKSQKMNVGDIGTASQYAFNVYSRLASTSGIATFKNSSSTTIFDFRQLVGHATLALKDSSGTQKVYLEAQNGSIDVATQYKCNGNNGIGGTGGTTYTFGGGGSGDIASMTFHGGILTAVTTVP